MGMRERANRSKPWRAAALAAMWLFAGGGCARGSDAVAARVREPVVGLPCEGCELVFEGLPATIATVARIAPANEPGEAMRIEGAVVDRQGRPAPGVIVYAYHTDAHGIYPRVENAAGSTNATSSAVAASTRHGRLRGWALTDETGRYRFDTIRPAGYPDTSIPQHVHMHVIEPGRCTYYIDELRFEDDPRLTAEERGGAEGARGGSGIVMPRRDDAGLLIATRDIVLGENIPGYPGR